MSRQKFSKKLTRKAHEVREKRYFFDKIVEALRIMIYYLTKTVILAAMILTKVKNF